MIPNWSTAAQAQLAGGSLRAAFFLRVAASSGVVRMWSGIGDFEYGGDTIEPDASAIWLGLGTLEGLPAVQGLINGLAERAEFRLSGAFVTSEMLQLATWEAADIRGALVNLGLIVLDDTLAALSPMAWLWTGAADSLTVQRSQDKGAPTRTIVLSVGSVFTGRRRPTPETWTDYNQRAADPTDSFCQYVANYNAGSTRVWPSP